MVEQEVENTLREIRERVVAESAQKRAVARTVTAAHQPATPSVGAAGAATDSGGDGEALSRLRANLSTTGRAWSRLPPLVSYRGGAAARVELWLKRQIKRAAHWFTWEQVNFNSAVHHALGDALDALDAHGQTLDAQARSLAAHEEALSALRDELRDELRQQRAEAESSAARVSELRARLAAAESRFDGALAGLRRSLEEADGRLRAEQNALAAALREEQQAAVMQDRARRRIESRIEALEQSRGR